MEVEICNDAVSEQSPMLPANDMTTISPNDVSVIPHLCTEKENIVQKHLTIIPPILEFAGTKIGSALGNLCLGNLCLDQAVRKMF